VHEVAPLLVSTSTGYACPAPLPDPGPRVVVSWLARHAPVPVDVAASGALGTAAVVVEAAVVAAEVADVAADVAAEAAEPADAGTVVFAPAELALGVQPVRAATTAPRVKIATSPARPPDPVPMAGRYSRAGPLSVP
jgi:hypothetical protein